MPTLSQRLVCRLSPLAAVTAFLLGSASGAVASDHGGHAAKKSDDHAAAADHAAKPAADAHGGGHGEVKEEPIEIDPTQPRTLDLGEFEFRSFRPTQNDITTIRFKLYLVVDKDAGEEMMTRLGHWQRRFRDQAITAVRLARPEDLLEPELKRLQRHITIRLKRLPFTDLIEGVYLTEFLVEKGSLH